GRDGPREPRRGHVQARPAPGEGRARLDAEGTLRDRREDRGLARTVRPEGRREDRVHARRCPPRPTTLFAVGHARTRPGWRIPPGQHAAPWYRAREAQSARRGRRVAERAGVRPGEA